MNFEKLVNSKINRIADWIIRLIVLNVLMIATSLAVITIYPSLVAGYNMFNDYINDRDTKLFKGYFSYFKENFVRKVIVSIIIILVAFIGITNVMYYNDTLAETNNLFYSVGYFATLSLLAIFYAVTMYTFVVVRVNSKMRYTSLFKLSFYLAGKNFLITILLVFVNSIPIVLLFFPRLLSVIILVGLSLPMSLNALLTNGVVRYLEDLGEKNG